ncbi:MAG: hypothetical protein ACYTXT_25925 [Nostoc sp.]|uniref:hypothetical protein n=1 Tax=unclassified Nostoc TaxID=2593658 RepID=UPI001DD16374|nr:hypothetical protein [Nostoc sp. JL23]MBN3875678.1 hypothetical protein [Nostoc sp. JL23]
MEKIYRVATVAGVEILRQRQLKDSVPDLRWVSAESLLPFFVKILLISPSQ